MPRLLPLFLTFLLALGAKAQNQNADPFPASASKKGLQVQMLDDALALGIKHAAINCTLAALIAPAPAPDAVRWQSEGREFTFDAAYLAGLDKKIRPLSEAGIVVYLIILNPSPTDPAKQAILLHPKYDPDSYNKMSAFNTVTPDGIAWLRAASEMLAERYSTAGEHGRVWGWIVGNEVTSHWAWFNMGRVPVREVADAYEQAVRIVHGAVRRFSANARLYLSFDHHWIWRFLPDSPDMAVGGKELLDEFARFARERGDFDWHLAQHPYAENLRDPRFWHDLSATDNFNSPRITFKNIEVLARYLAQPELLWQGQPRRILLSEQGFNHRDDWPDGEAVQAAAWWMTSRLEGIDAFILHRHVDHTDECGLHLGLWTTKPNSGATPVRKR